MPAARTALALLALAAAVLLAACGGASQEDFAEQANAICRDVERDIDRLNQGRITSLDEAQRRVDALNRKLGEVTTRLGDVERPGGDEGERAGRFVSEFTRSSAAARQALSGLIPALRARDQRRLTQLTGQLRRLDDPRLTRLARDAGLRECAT
jgi:hypothetical protein